jgi:hypothetical protein
MNATELALTMLEWENLQRQADLLKVQIEAEVLARAKTHTVGNVRASYSGGRKSYHYDGALEAAIATGALEAAMLDPFRVMTLDGKKACTELHITPTFTQGDPSVTVKLMA